MPRRRIRSAAERAGRGSVVLACEAVLDHPGSDQVAAVLALVAARTTALSCGEPGPLLHDGSRHEEASGR